MSSHHIIRDEQEPPVLVFQLHQNWGQLSELLGWSPIVLVKPELADFFHSKQTKIDGYLLKEELYTDTQYNDFVYSDQQLTNALLIWIRSKKYTAVNIFCDHKLMLELFHDLKGEQLAVPLIFFTESGKCILKSASNFKKWYPSQFRIEILSEGVRDFRNLRKEGDIYSVEKEGFVYVEVESDLLLINEKDVESCDL
ncbi:hypothetical protein SAMN05661096_01179 [Marivirga sericea]|uniref:Thiamine pyrophosphokinase n=1 Tax=Marivirga sericea TaxID=1028 RepID=A0A1X7J1G9_9BACT|nr:hypothetical protein [Marivirga sericea]SMG21350.1 hypothetical protein SAMN05661096_01179 [Marivirga sericea]